MSALSYQVFRSVVNLRAQGWAWPDIAELVALPLRDVEDLPWQHRRTWQRDWQFATEMQRQESLRNAVAKVQATLLATNDPKTVATLTNALARLLKLQEPARATNTRTHHSRARSGPPAPQKPPVVMEQPRPSAAPVRPPRVGAALGGGIVALVVLLLGLRPTVNTTNGVRLDRQRDAIDGICPDGLVARGEEFVEGRVPVGILASAAVARQRRAKPDIGPSHIAQVDGIVTVPRVDVYLTTERREVGQRPHAVVRQMIDVNHIRVPLCLRQGCPADVGVIEVHDVRPDPSHDAEIAENHRTPHGDVSFAGGCFHVQIAGNRRWDEIVGAKPRMRNPEIGDMEITRWFNPSPQPKEKHWQSAPAAERIWGAA